MYILISSDRKKICININKNNEPTRKYTETNEVPHCEDRDLDKKINQIVMSSTVLIVPHSKSGIVPRSSLLGAGRLGIWEVGKGGTVG